MAKEEFLIDAEGPKGVFGVFEDDGETGYLYIYEPTAEPGTGIRKHLHLYDRNDTLDIVPTDVRVIWSRDRSKCGVVIWKKMMGIIDLRRGIEGRVWLEGPETPGISDTEWLRGFDMRDVDE